MVSVSRDSAVIEERLFAPALLFLVALNFGILDLGTIPFRTDCRSWCCRRMNYSHIFHDFQSLDLDTWIEYVACKWLVYMAW
jgi:hypothetical protein